MTTHDEEIALLKRAIAASERAEDDPGIVLVDDQGTPVHHLDTKMDPQVREALEERLRKIE